MCENLPGDGEKQYWSLAGAVSFGPFAFVKWNDYPIPSIRWDTNRLPDSVEDQILVGGDRFDRTLKKVWCDAVKASRPTTLERGDGILYLGD